MSPFRGHGRLRLCSPYPLYLTVIAGLLLTLVGAVTAQSTGAPTESPDAAAGLSLFNERCATCHGAQALGDGELAADLPNPPAALTAPEMLRAAVPADMFNTVTDGRVEQGMPPFGPTSSNPLTDAERWNVIAAVYSLGTPIDSVERGRAIYEESCLSCHGESGSGNGPGVTNATDSPGDLSRLDYWSNISNQAVFDLLADSERIPAHDYDLGDGGLKDEDLWSTIDYMRTFGYDYTDALAAFRPLEAALISGLVANGTSGDAVPPDAIAHLRAFTQDLQITLSMTETLGADGRYQFELTDVPQDWFYRVAVTYDDLEFGSDFGQLSYLEPELDLPVTVYGKTTDPEGIAIEQLHIILAFGEDQVTVSELYVVDNDDATVFVGESGDVTQGTFEFTLPAGAQTPDFQRGFGSVDSFIPANEIIASETGWADTLPLRPGPGSLTLLARYTLPYDGEASISHPILYPAAGVNLVLPDAGVSLDKGDNWSDTGQQTMGNTTVSTYGQSAVPAGSIVSIDLEGQPRLTAGPPGSLIRDNRTELVIGAAAAIGVAAVAAVVVRQWRLDAPPGLSREELIQAIADLDDDYEAGAIGEREYRRERAELKSELRAIWVDQEAE